MYNENESPRTDAVFLREDSVDCDGFRLTYKLIKRVNLDNSLRVRYVYDLFVTKNCTNAETGESAVIPAASSLPERALAMYECMVRNTVTPMCIAEFFEEYHSIN